MKLTKSKLKEIIREVISEEKAGEHGMAFAQYVVVKDSKGKIFNYNPKKKELEPFGGGKKMKLSQIDDKKFVQSLKKIKL